MRLSGGSVGQAGPGGWVGVGSSVRRTWRRFSISIANAMHRNRAIAPPRAARMRIPGPVGCTGGEAGSTTTRATFNEFGWGPRPLLG
jgi:hypothetical protein